VAKQAKVKVAIVLDEVEAQKVLASLEAVAAATKKVEGEGAEKQTTEQNKVTEAARKTVGQYDAQIDRLKKAVAAAKELMAVEQVREARLGAPGSVPLTSPVLEKIRQENLGTIGADPEKIKIAAAAIAEQAKGQYNVSAAIKDSIVQYEFEDEALNKLLRKARELGKDEQFYAILHKKGYVEGSVAIQKMLGLKAKDIGMTKEQIKEIQRHATILRHESIALRRSAADLHLFAQSAFIAGSATIGGILLLAKQYSDQMGDTTKVSREFLAAQEQLKAAKNRIGEVFARESVPFIREATKILDRAGKFIQEHPEIVSAALKGGEILIAVGLLGKAVATGTRLTADALAIHSSILRIIATRAEEEVAAAKQLAAAELMNAAADKQLTAAEGMVVSPAPAASKLATALNTPTAIVGLIVAIGLVSYKTAQQLEKLEDIFKALEKRGGRFAAVWAPLYKIIESGTLAVNPLAISIKNFKDNLDRDIPLITKLFNDFTGTTKDAAANVTPSVIFSEQFSAVLKAYEDYTADDLKLVKDHYAEREDIVRKGLDAEKKENEQNLKRLEDIRAQANKATATLRRNFARQEADDERDYARDRAKILKDAGEDALQAEADLQEKLRKLRLEYEEREVDLLAARDAVGLVKNRLKYIQDRAEAIREANLEIAKKRKDIADRLRILDEEFDIQRQRRQEDFETRLEEIQREAREKLIEQQKAHTEEIAAIRKNTAEKLRDELVQFNEERKRRYQDFLQRIRDLDAGLLGEKALRKKRQDEMIADLDAFLAAYRAKHKTLLTTISATAGVGTRATGGYATFGTYLLGDKPTGGRGDAEFVLRGRTTRAAETIIGGRLTQEGILRAMLAGGQKNVTLNDHRRFDSRLSVEDRRAILQDTKQMLSELVS